MELFLIKNRMVSHTKLRDFVHGKTLSSRLRKKLGWSKTIVQAVLKAYSEFIELKIVLRDWDTMQILPSWSIRKVWRLHILYTKVYNESCNKLCGHVIHYDPDVETDKVASDQKIEFTKKAYFARFNRGLSGGVWYFEYEKLWWKRYVDTVIRIPRISNEALNNKTAGSSVANVQPLPLELKEESSIANVQNCLSEEKVQTEKEAGTGALGDNEKQKRKKSMSRSLSSENISSIMTRSKSKKQKLSI